MEEHGLTPAALETQLKNFREGFPFLPVTRAASCGDGIRVLDAAGIEQAAARYDRAKESLRVVKFVPASGAATRMFKDLFEFVREGRRTAVVGELLANRRRFAFWPELRTIVGDDADELRTVENIVAEGLRYGETPKGLVSFHRYGDEVRKAVEEHLVEGAQYAAAMKEMEADQERMRASRDALKSINDSLSELIQKSISTQDAIQQNMNQTRSRILG